MINGVGQDSFYSVPRDAQRTAGTVSRQPALQAEIQSLDASAKISENTRAASSNSSISFMDFIKGVIDIVNPLQHIPVVSTLYRNITGDEISPVARIVGDTLYGGPVGTAVALADVVTEKTTGKDIGQTVLAMVQPQKSDNAGIDVASYRTLPAYDIIWNDDLDNGALASNDIHALPGSGTPTTSARTDGTVAALESRSVSHIPSHMRTDVTTKERIADIATAATTNGAISERTGKDSGRTPALLPVDPTRFLQTQDALVGDERISLPPGLIAPKMMEALDKYSALKTADAVPSMGFRGMY